MQYFLLSNPTEIELRYLMDCREYLQVTTLAYITTIDGTEIMLHAWQGRIYKRKVFSHSWPRQPPRKRLDWDLCRHTLTPMIQNTTNRSLMFLLGRWRKKPLTIGSDFTPALPISYMPDMTKFTQTAL